jgi:hypothetical protein
MVLFVILALLFVLPQYMGKWMGNSLLTSYIFAFYIVTDITWGISRLSSYLPFHIVTFHILGPMAHGPISQIEREHPSHCCHTAYHLIISSFDGSHYKCIQVCTNDILEPFQRNTSFVI